MYFIFVLDDRRSCRTIWWRASILMSWYISLNSIIFDVSNYCEVWFLQIVIVSFVCVGQYCCGFHLGRLAKRCELTLKALFTIGHDQWLCTSLVRRKYANWYLFSDTLLGVWWKKFKVSVKHLNCSCSNLVYPVWGIAPTVARQINLRI